VRREDALAALGQETFDVLVIGGGASGLGAAVDAAARGYRTALIEAEDFGGATSSRSTKLIHGGVRYLRSGAIGLVREALHERTTLHRNAPHLVGVLRFVVPVAHWRELPYYFVGLTAYDALAGRSEFPRSRTLAPEAARALFPALAPGRARAALAYADGQFDDARLAITLARTAVDRGATLANYVRATGFLDAGERVAGVVAVDAESGRGLEIRARALINATGSYVDRVRALDDPHALPLLAHSRGSHLVLNAEALESPTAALLVPRTADGRVLFLTPWHGRVILGTTDVAVPGPERDPRPSAEEIAYLLATANRYLARRIDPTAIVSAFAGLRALVGREEKSTAALSREHLVDVGRSGLVTLAGGKWTTYRRMAAEAVDVAAREGGLTRAPSVTQTLRLHGVPEVPAEDETLRVYGTDAAALTALAGEEPRLGERLDPRLPYLAAQVVYAARDEMARTVEDVLARRTRALILDAEAARACAPQVAALLARELGRDEAWEAEQRRIFDALADRYTVTAAERSRLAEASTKSRNSRSASER
jgi:glycerol-3-phosphate dehydrogenase